MFGLVVYALCAVTSLACAMLLFRAFKRTRTPFLMWTALCFAGFFLNNLLLLVDQQVPWRDLSIVRSLPALAGVLLLLYGLIWEAST